MAHAVALDIHETAGDNWDHVSWEGPEAGRGRHRWLAVPVEGKEAFHPGGAASPQNYGGEGRQCAQARRLVLGRRPV